MARNRRDAYWVGGILIGIGLLFLLSNVGLFDFGFLFRNFWPVLLIGIGVWIIIAQVNKKGGEGVRYGDKRIVSENESVNYINTFGDLKLVIDNKSFKGGRVRTTFGELSVDMTKISLEQGEHILDLRVVFGEINVSLPKDVPIKIVATNVAGDIKLFEQKWEGLNKTANWKSEEYDTATTKLEIFCNIVFGDIKIW